MSATPRALNFDKIDTLNHLKRLHELLDCPDSGSPTEQKEGAL